MIDKGLFYKCYDMEILSPMKWLQFHFGNMMRNISLPVKDSEVTHRRCTKSKTGIVTKDTSNDVPILTIEKNVSKFNQSNGFSTHWIIASVIPRNVDGLYSWMILPTYK